ncbi:hypothetical protein SCLCIDRAFT_21653 [Scleroderma citrinum Foug A]|uniref:Uncharacterized protein n=1 Tax=Scleroderma citrinum Foug A TaxID=1036808 RepID=A0A0C3EEZ3_9AGAM|nr:hypothetical protein SCLCIDRAFT_21653 [Scleroderma citrinum Foug A]
MDSYCASLSSPVASPEPVFDSSPATTSSHSKRYPRTRGHPRPSATPVLPPVVASTSSPRPSAVASQSGKSVPAKPDKGKGRQRATPTPPPSGSVDASPASVSTDSFPLTPEQHVCLVRMLKRLDEWLAQGWQPGINESHLRTLAEIFNTAESIAVGSLSNICHADLAWRLADSKGWEKSAGSSIMGAIDIQKLNWIAADALQAYQDRLFRRTQVSQIHDQTYRRGFDSKGWTAHLEELAMYAENGMREADNLLAWRVPAFLHMMKRARVLPSTSPLLVECLTGNGATSCSHFVSLLPEPTLSVPAMPLVRSLTDRLPCSSPTTNYATFSQAVDASRTPTPSEDFDAFNVTPLGTGHPTMTEVINQFMEDLLTQEFCPVTLAEDS